MHKVGIGCGDMGGNHARAWTAHPDVEVVAVSDPDHQRAQKLAQTYNAQVYTDWESLINESTCTIVSVCTPACFHAPISIAAAEAGNHVLCEKPMALTLAEADAMLAAAEAHSVMAIAHQYRWNPDSRAMTDLVPQLGSPLYVRFHDAREVRPKTAMHSKRLRVDPFKI